MLFRSPNITLTSAGDGEDLEHCRQEAASLGLADRVRFLGKVPREEVERLYSQHDVFFFPSFREPMGGVLFEAMAWGLPIVTANYGGPGFIVDETCGIKVEAVSPEQYARELAMAVRNLATSPHLLATLSAGSHKRLLSFGSWSEKADALLGLYESCLKSQAASDKAGA